MTHKKSTKPTLDKVYLLVTPPPPSLSPNTAIRYASGRIASDHAVVEILKSQYAAKFTV